MSNLLYSKKTFNELFSVGTVYENSDRQKEAFDRCKEMEGLEPIQLNHLFKSVIFQYH